MKLKMQSEKKYNYGKNLGKYLHKPKTVDVGRSEDDGVKPERGQRTRTNKATGGVRG